MPSLIAATAARDLAGDEVLPAARRLVVEEDAVAHEHPVRLAVVDRDPVGVDLGGGVRGARVERRRLRLRDLAGPCRTSPRSRPGRSDGAMPLSRIASRRRSVPSPAVSAVYSGMSKLTLHVALGAEVVDLVGLHLAKQAVDRRRVGQVAVVQEAGAAVRVAQMVDAGAIEGAEPAGRRRAPRTPFRAGARRDRSRPGR